MIKHRAKGLLTVLTSAILVVGLLAACDAPVDSGRRASTGSVTASASPSGDPPVGGAAPSSSPVAVPRVAAAFRSPLPGMPPVIGSDVYAGAGAGMVAASVRRDPSYLYVPDAAGARVTVISQRTHRIVRVLHTGRLSQHVTPSYGLRLLYVESSASNELVVINPRTARIVKHAAVPRPYNLYFTPDGRQAVVMVEQHNKIMFAAPGTFRPRAVRGVKGCRGPNHADFAANGQFLVLTCEFSGAIVKMATTTHKVLGVLHFGAKSMPQDIRVSPDGRLFYVADMGRNRIRLIDGARFRQVGTIRTPSMPHGLYPSRGGKLLYVSDRGAGKVSVISFATHKIIHTWRIPGGGSPDMGGVTADGKVLWLSGRFDGVVYGFQTRTGRLVARIRVGGSPHGMLVWPQPGRYSLGHTGNTR